MGVKMREEMPLSPQALKMHLDREPPSPLRCFLTSGGECCRYECFESRVLLSTCRFFEPTRDVECKSDLRVGTTDFGSSQPDVCNRRVYCIRRPLHFFGYSQQPRLISFALCEVCPKTIQSLLFLKQNTRFFAQLSEMRRQ